MSAAERRHSAAATLARTCSGVLALAIGESHVALQITAGGGVAALRALEGISPRELLAEQQLDRLALRSLLLKECEDYARGRYALEPNASDQFLNILLHELQRGDDEPRRAARNLRSLLKQAPDFLDDHRGLFVGVGLVHAVIRAVNEHDVGI